MRTIEVFRKKYRDLDGKKQNIVIEKIKGLFPTLSHKAVEDACWDANHFVGYGDRFVSFEPNSFARLCGLAYEYEESFKQSQ